MAHRKESNAVAVPPVLRIHKAGFQDGNQGDSSSSSLEESARRNNLNVPNSVRSTQFGYYNFFISNINFSGVSWWPKYSKAVHAPKPIRKESSSRGRFLHYIYCNCLIRYGACFDMGEIEILYRSHRRVITNILISNAAAN